MPVYEFKCKDCGEIITEFRKMGDFTPAKCQKCGSSNSEKLLSRFSSKSRAASSSGCAPSGGG